MYHRMQRGSAECLKTWIWTIKKLGSNDGINIRFVSWLFLLQFIASWHQKLKLSILCYKYVNGLKIFSLIRYEFNHSNPTRYPNKSCKVSKFQASGWKINPNPALPDPTLTRTLPDPTRTQPNFWAQPDSIRFPLQYVLLQKTRGLFSVAFLSEAKTIR